MFTFFMRTGGILDLFGGFDIFYHSTTGFQCCFVTCYFFLESIHRFLSRFSTCLNHVPSFNGCNTISTILHTS
ncbi:hypothetical protein Hanom_Chr16g01459311 [Helianthus anomalus]